MRVRRCGALVLAALWCLATGAHGEGGLSVVLPEQLRGWLAGADPPELLDARGGEAWRAGTVAGAVNVGLLPAGFRMSGSPRVVVLILAEPVDEQLAAAWRVRLTEGGTVVYRLAGRPDDWRVAGLPVEQPAVTYTRPGAVPFTVPRGLCEMNTPAQEFQ